MPPKKIKSDDTITVERKDININILHESLTKFIVGCGLSFSLVENKNFKNFVGLICKSYAERLPSRKTLSTRLMDSLYDACILEGKSIIDKDVCLVGDCWKNVNGKQENFAIISHNVGQTPIFINSFDYTAESANSKNITDSVRYPKYYIVE